MLQAGSAPKIRDQLDGDRGQQAGHGDGGGHREVGVQAGEARDGRVAGEPECGEEEDKAGHAPARPGRADRENVVPPRSFDLRTRRLKVCCSSE